MLDPWLDIKTKKQCSRNHGKVIPWNLKLMLVIRICHGLWFLSRYLSIVITIDDGHMIPNILKNPKYRWNIGYIDSKMLCPASSWLKHEENPSKSVFFMTSYGHQFELFGQVCLQGREVLDLASRMLRPQKKGEKGEISRKEWPWMVISWFNNESTNHGE